MSLTNYQRLVSAQPNGEIAAPTAEGEAVRRRVGRRLVEENEKSWHPVGVHLGYIYDPSPIVVPDGSAKPEDDTIGYQPTSFPGARAPHVWLSPPDAKGGKSILDLFGDGFVLLNFAGLPTAALEQAAAERTVPLTVEPIASREAAALYEKPLVLVRPDGHVAWRGNAVPADALALIDTVRGAGPRVAARRAVS